VWLQTEMCAVLHSNGSRLFCCGVWTVHTTTTEVRKTTCKCDSRN
jgi:hypothetical protein